MPVGSDHDPNADEAVHSLKKDDGRALDERKAAELRSALSKMKEELGAEEFYKLAINLFETMEDELRKTSPESPALKLLDEHRAKENRGFE